MNIQPERPKGGEPLHATEAILVAIDSIGSDRISLKELSRVLGDQGVALAMLVFALPNCIPAPPGLGSILGIPLFLIGFCLARGWPLWLPAFIGRRDFAHADLRRVVVTASRRLAPIEKRMRPRLQMLVSSSAETPLGILVMVLSLVIALPLPLTNMVPAFGIALIALGLVERDGLFVFLGILVGAAGAILASTVVTAFFVAPLVMLFGS